jgi:hypothetical protein
MAIALLAILAAAALLNDYYAPIGGRRARVEHLVAPLAFAIFAGWQVARRQRPLRVDVFAALALAWVAVNALSSVLYAPQLSESIVHVVRMGLLMAIFLTIANLPFQSASAWASGLRLWLALGVVELAYGLLIWLLAQLGDVWLPGAYLEPLVPGINIKGTQYERNLFGIFSGTLWFVATYIFLAQRAPARRAAVASSRFLGTASALAAVVTVLSLTRSAWLAVAVTGPVAWLLLDRRRWGAIDRPLRQATIGLPLVLVLLVGVMRLVPAPSETEHGQRTMVTGSPRTGVGGGGARGSAAAAPVDERLSTFGRLDSDFTTITRVQDAKWALADWQRSPLLGHGTGSFSQIHGMRAGTEAWISNLPLHTMVDTGIAGLAIQSTLIVLIGLRAWHASQKTAEPSLSVGLKAMTLGLILMLIAYQITDGSWLAIFWIHLALMANGIYRVNDELRRGPAAAHSA